MGRYLEKKTVADSSTGRMTVAGQFVRRHLNWFVFCGFLAIVLLITLPFALRPFQTLISPINGDAGYSSILFEAIKREHLNPFVDGLAQSVAYPDGITNNTGVNRVSFFSTLLLWTGTLITNAIFIHSFLAILGVVLSGYITFLFVKRLTGSVISAVVSGLIIMAMPAMMSILFSASAYTHMWLYTAVIWCLWWLCLDRPIIGRFLRVYGIVFLTLFWTPYYSFHILLIVMAMSIIVAVLYKNRYGWRTSLFYLISATTTLMIFAGIYYGIGITAEHAEVPVRTVDEIYQQSSHPLMYVLPGMFTIAWHGAYNFLTELVPRAAYTSLYIGISTIAVACFSLTLLRRSTGNKELKYGVVLGVTVVVVSFLFSLAPTIHIAGVTIPTPNYVVAQFVPALRAGQRLVMPLIAGISILSGIGLYSISKRLPRNRRSLAIVLLAIVIIVDIASFPVARYTLIEQRDIFHELSMKKKGLAAVYLHNSLVSNPGQNICYPQFQYKMPLINDCAIQRDPYNFDKPKKTLATIIVLPLCRQLQSLHERQVVYIIVSKDDNADIANCLSDQHIYKATMQDTEYVIYTSVGGKPMY